jgi:hypothetical protein
MYNLKQPGRHILDSVEIFFELKWNYIRQHVKTPLTETVPQRRIILGRFGKMTMYLWSFRGNKNTNKNKSQENILFDQTCGFGKELFLNFSWSESLIGNYGNSFRFVLFLLHVVMWKQNVRLGLTNFVQIYFISHE